MTLQRKRWEKLSDFREQENWVSESVTYIYIYIYIYIYTRTYIWSHSLSLPINLHNQNAPYAIMHHLLANKTSMFSILDTTSTDIQLSTLDTIYITTYQLALCKQKDFYNLLIFKSIDHTSTKPGLSEKKKGETNKLGNWFFLSFSFLWVFLIYFLSTSDQLSIFLGVDYILWCFLMRHDQKKFFSELMMYTLYKPY